MNDTRKNKVEVTPCHVSSTHTIRLSSGDEVTLAISTNLLALTLEERRWLTDLIDLFTRQAAALAVMSANLTEDI
jgi:hypothetical protein